MSKGNALRIKLFALASVVFIVATISPAKSWPPKISAPGASSLFNPLSPGDTISAFVTGPSISQFEGASNRVVDRAMSELAQLTDKETDKFMALLRDQAQSAIQSLDETLSAQITEADQAARNNEGVIYVILSKNIVDISRALEMVVLFAIILVAFAYLLWKFYLEIFDQKKTLRMLFPRIALSVAVVALFGFGSYVAIATMHTGIVQHMAEAYRRNYVGALNTRGLDQAVRYATQLEALEELMESPENQTALRLHWRVFKRLSCCGMYLGGAHCIERLPGEWSF